VFKRKEFYTLVIGINMTNGASTNIINTVTLRNFTDESRRKVAKASTIELLTSHCLVK